ncbi:hypothetical protein GW17_00021804 [Ensete ventricosum]|uniref:Uncharacterized protein n=1 Tax=Ensete ventricosum TaxID=4639 RepID=A0A444EVG1_ENSVE|nr:hypothetical protein GW17_00021804 [Ensete ventricosum]RZR73919.1 hypothetical protein BHM03_00029670 [Ensete ventricosum]
MSTERLNKSSDRIKESTRTTLASEEVGVSFLQDLHQQGQPLLHAHVTVCFCSNLLVFVATSCTFFSWVNPLYSVSSVVFVITDLIILVHAHWTI